MPYVLSLSLLALGLVLLVLLLVTTWRAVRRLLRARKLVMTDVADRGGMLKARLAAVRVAFAERRNGPSQRTY